MAKPDEPKTSASGTSSYEWPKNRRISVKDLRKAKERGEKWAMLTSYDALTAGIFDEAGIKILLVGDSAGNVIYGHETTVPVELDDLIHLAAGVVRGTKTAFIVGDLPFGSYQISLEQTLTSATRYLKEAGVQAVKLEGGKWVLERVEALVNAGIPVMGHLGMTPQSVHVLGGLQYVQGRGEHGVLLLEEAKALEAAGAFSIVLEAIPSELAKEITEALSIPVVGIGAGINCDAQVLVWQDMAGLTTGKRPRFVKEYANLRGVLSEATTQFVNDVVAGSYPDDKHSYE